MVYTIQIPSHKKKVKAIHGDLLADKIVEAGIDLSLYCNKKGMCGKCFVEIVKGALPASDDREKNLRLQKGLAENFRLACSYKVSGNLSINIPEASLLQQTLILKTGIRLPIFINPPVKKYYLELKKPDLATPLSLSELLEHNFRKRKLHIRLQLMKDLPEILAKSGFHITAVLFDEDEIISIEPDNTTEYNFGIAVDIGTTTLVVELIDLNTGASLDLETANNPQMKFGADVVSRISAAYMDSKDLDKLREAIVQILSQMIGRMLERNHIKPDFVYEIVFAGNTAMNHFLVGMPVNSLAVSPFHALFRTLPELSAAELGFYINPGAKAHVVPNIKSFVGGDISAGLMATDLSNRKGNYLFIDLGTNGEIVLKTERTFIATSTAAGPAFEGMNISAGMLALPGAIYKAEKKKKLVLYTIDNGPARGICGTGLIDLIAIFLDEGRITSSGAIADGAKSLPVTDSVCITQKDVREIQLAVAAIKSGVRMILKKFRLQKHQLDKIFIAGAFGNYLNIKNSMKLGLLPGIDPEKIVFIGNSSLAGARALLLSGEARRKTETLIKKIQYISLATDPRFQDYFIDALEFGDRSDSS